MGKEQKKPRSMEIKFNISKDTKINIGNYILSVSGVNASGNNSTDITTYMERKDKKSKVITKYTTVKHNISGNPEELMDELDYIFVVDTNTVQIDTNTKCCIGVVGQVVKDKISSKLGLRKLCHMIYEIPLNDNNHEKYTWIKLICEITKAKDYSADKKIGIIVDAYLSDLDTYNKGNEILEGFILPSNFKFIYASADKSGDNFFTWAIKQCDNQANKLKKEI